MNQISLADAQPEILRILKIRAASMNKNDTFENKTGRPGECMIFVINGNAVYSTANEQFSLSTGCVLFLRRGTTYSMMVNSENYAFIFVEFQLSDLPHTLKNELFDNCSNELEKLFKQLIETDVLKRHSSKISCLSVLYRIYDELIKSVLVNPSSTFKHAQIERAAYEIQQNFTDPSYSVYTTAKKTGMSEAYFRRLFKSEYGKCPVQYLISLKISHAKNLLIYQKYDISQVAAMSGFSDIYYFSRRFKKETGMTPTEYKRYVNSY